MKGLICSLIDIVVYSSCSSQQLAREIERMLMFIVTIWLTT
jgi:hypothetical protein